MKMKCFIPGESFRKNRFVRNIPSGTVKIAFRSAIVPHRNGKLILKNLYQDIPQKKRSGKQAAVWNAGAWISTNAACWSLPIAMRSILIGSEESGTTAEA